MATKTVKKTIRVKKTIVSAESGQARVTIKTPSKSTNVGLTMPVINLDGKETGTINLPEELFKVEASPRLVAQYVRVYLANQRQGTASTKHRGEIKGSTRKIYRQKGTGNARHGSNKAPLFVGGGVDSGPKPTDHTLQMNKKQKKRALFSVLSNKLKHKAMVALGKDVIEMKPKTKMFISLLKTMDADTKKVMVVVSQKQDGMKLSLRNLKKVQMVNTASLNAYNVMHHDKVLFSEEALTQLSSLYLKK